MIANGIVYQWNKEPNKEILIQNTPMQHLNQQNPTRKLLILYTVTLQVTNTIVQQMSRTVCDDFRSSNHGYKGEELTSFDNLYQLHNTSFTIPSQTTVATCSSFFPLACHATPPYQPLTKENCTWNRCFATPQFIGSMQGLSCSY